MHVSRVSLLNEPEEFILFLKRQENPEVLCLFSVLKVYALR